MSFTPYSSTPVGCEEAADLATAPRPHRPPKAVPVRQRALDQVPQDCGLSCLRAGSHRLFGRRAGRYPPQVNKNFKKLSQKLSDKK